MGVPGLWDLLRPAATRSSLSSLSKSAYQTNRHGTRAFTIGIDASLWIFHSQVPTAGENPALRTLYFRICTLLQQPVLPIFVFDGPQKPSSKRGNRVGGAFGTSDKSSLMFKALLNECGLEWWNAPGEAEAELAVMNRQGKIDAVLSDDVDALLFGATCLLRNNSSTLSGTQASAHVPISKGDMKTYEIYRSSTITETWTSKEGSALQTEEDCRMAMVYVALLAGGDYVPEGLGSFGAITAFALAHAGLSDKLHTYTTNPNRFISSTPEIKARMIEELRTNSTGHVGRKNPAKASKLSEMAASDLFPSSSLQAYLQPATSPLGDLSAGWPGFGLGGRSSGRGMARNGGRGDLEGMARACEKYFEWGTRDLVCKKFAGESTGVFGSEMMVAARNKRMEADKASSGAGPSVQAKMTSYFNTSTSGPVASGSKSGNNAQRGSSPGKAPEIPSYILKIERTRPDPTCPELTEVRIQYETQSFNDRVHAAMSGTRIDPKYLSAEEREKLGMVAVAVDAEDEEGAPSASQAKADKGLARIWMADWLVKDAWPSLVDEYEEKEAAKKAKVMGKGRTKSAGTTTPKKGKAKAPAKPKRAVTADAGALDCFFGATQAEAVPAPTLAATQRKPTQGRVVPARQPSAQAGPSRQPSAQAGPSRLPSASGSTRSTSASTRPYPIAGDVIVINDSDDEMPARVDPKRKALDLSSTPTPPRRTSRAPPKKAATRETNLLNPSSRAPTRSKSPQPAGPSRVRAKAPASTRGTSAGSQATAAIVISSDEEEAPRMRTVSPPDSLDRLINRRTTRRSILSPSNRQNTASPPARSSPTLPIAAGRGKSPLVPAKQPAKAAAARPQQGSLGMPVVASAAPSRSSKGPSAGPSTPRSSSPTRVPSLSPSKSRTAARSSPSPLLESSEGTKGRTRPRRSYIVLDDGGEDGIGIMDCTRGGRLLSDGRR